MSVGSARRIALLEDLTWVFLEGLGTPCSEDSGTVQPPGTSTSSPARSNATALSSARACLKLSLWLFVETQKPDLSAISAKAQLETCKA